MNDLIVKVLTKERGGAGTFEVYAPFSYGNITVPAGFRTDFCTVPRLARWLIAQAGRGARAALLHDYLLSANDGRANDVFEEVLRAEGVGGVRRWLMVTFVRWWTV